MPQAVAAEMALAAAAAASPRTTSICEMQTPNRGYGGESYQSCL